MSLEKYVFQAAGVLICKAHYSNETLKWPSIKQSFYPASPSVCAPRTRYRLPVKPKSQKQRFIGRFLDSDLHFNYVAASLCRE